MATSRQATPKNAHSRWLRELATQLEHKRDTAGAHTCRRAADEVDALVLRLYPGDIDQIERYRSILTRICFRAPPKDAGGIRALCREGLALPGTGGDEPKFLFDPGTRIEVRGEGELYRARYLCPALQDGRHIVALGTELCSGKYQILTAATATIFPYTPRARKARKERASKVARQAASRN